MKQIPELQAGSNFIKKLSDEAGKFYRKNNRPKMKFGRAQVDKYGVPKIREIFEPKAILKYKQRQINSFLQTIPLPSSMFGGVIGRNNISNASAHRENKYFLKIDLKNYFRNITNNQVHQTLMNYGFSWEEARIITKLTTLKGSLPQGAPASTTLANLVFSFTALKLEAICANNGITFTNFVDDLAFSAKGDFLRIVPRLLDIVRQDGFFLNYNKIHYRRHSCEITGLFVRNGQLHLEMEMLLHIELPGIRGYANAVARRNFANQKAK